MCGTENNISLYMVHKVITIILISDEYYQFRIGHNSIGMNLIKEIHIYFTTKDIEI